MRILVTAAFIMTSIAMMGCQTEEDQYQNACDLLAEKEFEKAERLFEELSKLNEADLLGNPRAGVLLSRAGRLVEKDSLDQAYYVLETSVDSVVENEICGVYILNVAPDDKLFDVAKSVILWIKILYQEPRINEYLAGDYEYAWEIDGGDIPAEGLYYRIVTSFALEYDKYDIYYPYDYGYDIPTLYNHASFETTIPVGKFKEDITDEARKRFEEYIIKIDKKKSEVEDWYANKCISVVDNIDGVYEWDDGYSDAELEVRSLGSGKYSVKGLALYNKQNEYGPNIGEIEFEAQLRNNELRYYTQTYEDQSYELILSFNEGVIEAEETGDCYDCGMNVRFGGIYQRTSIEDETRSPVERNYEDQ